MPTADRCIFLPAGFTHNSETGNRWLFVFFSNAAMRCCPFSIPSLNQTVDPMPTGDGRQSGTSGSPSILNASPEAAIGGGLALLKTGDRVRIDLNKGTADMLVASAELTERTTALKKNGGYHYPPSQTPWQEIQRAMLDQLGGGMVLEPAVRYQRVAQISATTGQMGLTIRRRIVCLIVARLGKPARERRISAMTSRRPRGH